MCVTLQVRQIKNQNSLSFEFAPVGLIKVGIAQARFAPNRSRYFKCLIVVRNEHSNAGPWFARLLQVSTKNINIDIRRDQQYIFHLAAPAKTHRSWAQGCKP